MHAHHFRLLLQSQRGKGNQLLSTIRHRPHLIDLIPRPVTGVGQSTVHYTMDQTTKPTRSPKSGIDWTTSDLVANNIMFTYQSPQKFFLGNASPSLGGLDPTLFDSAMSAIGTDKIPSSTSRYLARLRYANNANQDQAGFIDDFAWWTLHLTGFEEDYLGLSAHYPIPSTICGYDLTAQIDVCLLDYRSMTLLILQLNKTIFDTTRPEPQLVAAAIAAYQYNNEIRQIRGLPALDTMIIPCIIMVGARPAFYLVPVTQALSMAVVANCHHNTRTEVAKCLTFLVDDNMEAPNHRRRVFEQFLAFRELAKTHWQSFLV